MAGSAGDLFPGMGRTLLVRDLGTIAVMAFRGKVPTVRRDAAPASGEIFTYCSKQSRWTRPSPAEHKTRNPFIPASIPKLTRGEKSPHLLHLVLFSYQR